MGRPLTDIDWGKVDDMLEAGCLTTEIAGYFGISADTLYLRCQRDKKIGFSAYSQQKHAKGELLLRQKQYEMALAGDRAMLIWLGKNRLKQSDKQDISHTGNTSVTVVNYSQKAAKKWNPQDEKPKDEKEP